MDKRKMVERELEKEENLRRHLIYIGADKQRIKVHSDRVDNLLDELKRLGEKCQSQ